LTRTFDTCSIISKSKSDVLKEDFRLFEMKYYNIKDGVSSARVIPDISIRPDEAVRAKFRTLTTEILQNKLDFERRLEKIKGVLNYFEKKQFDNNVELLLKLFIHEVSYLKNMEYDLNRVIAVI
jgi:hypothetical protein